MPPLNSQSIATPPTRAAITPVRNTFSIFRQTRASTGRQLVLWVGLAGLCGCSNHPGYGVQQSVRAQQQLGTVASIQILPRQSAGVGGGALLGAVLGGVVGHQIGGGSGRTIATGAGVIGGAMVEHDIANQQQGEQILQLP